MISKQFFFFYFSTDEFSFQVDRLKNFRLMAAVLHDAEQVDYQQEQFQLNKAMMQLP
jgi:hypothetical protein